ncbi:MAG: hypothetical protein ACLUJR_03450 [Mediterraneibacter gnavus]
MSTVIACTMVYPTITTLNQSGDGADFLGIPVQLSQLYKFCIADYFSLLFLRQNLKTL